MTIIQSYEVAVFLCIITMICWGSWANTQKIIEGKDWPFQLFYWDYCLGVLLFSFFMALTFGSIGEAGRPFVADLAQGSSSSLLFCLAGGTVFNLANILLVSAIGLAGMAVAFPLAIGIALVEGVILNYFFKPEGNPYLLFFGLVGVMLAISLAAIIYKKVSSHAQGKTPTKGIVVSLLAGILMGLFYYLVQKGMASNFMSPEAGLLGPYSASVVFSIGIFLSSFLWNTYVMKKPIVGKPVDFSSYFTKGDLKIHLVGVLGGVIWSIGTNLNFIASGSAGPAISYGLGQGATMIAALWGVFIWKEFKNAPEGINVLIKLKFFFYLLGLGLIISSKLI